MSDNAPYTVIDRVTVENVGECRDKLKQHGFVSEFITVDPENRLVTGEAKYGRKDLRSYEIYRHEDGRVMVILSAFAKSKKRLLDFWLAEVTLKEGF